MVRWKISLGIIGTLLSSLLYADTVKIGAVVIDDATALPMSDKVAIAIRIIAGRALVGTFSR